MKYSMYKAHIESGMSVAIILKSRIIKTGYKSMRYSKPKNTVYEGVLKKSKFDYTCIKRRVELFL